MHRLTWGRGLLWIVALLALGAGGIWGAVPAELPAVTSPSPAQHAPPPNPSPFGVEVVVAPDRQPASSLDAAFQAARDLGVGWVRVTPDWTFLEPSRNRFDWTATDAVIRDARQAGLSVLYTLGYTPRWAAMYADAAEYDVWNKNRPRDLGDWQRYVSAVARRYRGSVADWQAWEQSQLSNFRGSDQDMRDLLQATSRALHGILPDGAAGPSWQVVLPEEGGLDLQAINEYYQWNAQVFFDVLGLYPESQRPEDMLRPLRVLRREIVDRKGPQKAIWISSLGWDVSPVPGPLRLPVVTEAQQARYLVRGVALALSQGVQRVFWHVLQDDDGGPYQLQSHAGLLAADGRRRPAFGAYRALIAKLRGRSFAGNAEWGPHAYGPRFVGPDGSSVVVAWSDAGPSTLDTRGLNLQVWNLLGRPVKADGRVVLGASPQYVSGPTADVARFQGLRPEPRAPLPPDFSSASTVSVSLGPSPQEHGLYVSPYRQLAEHQVTAAEAAGAPCWQTDVANGKASILFDVDDSFLYFVDGRYEVDVDVQVYGNTSGQKMGFNLGYDSMKGFTFTRWQWVDAGPGWKTYSFHLTAADFSDNYSDFRINDLGSAADVQVRSVTVRRRRVE